MTMPELDGLGVARKLSESDNPPAVIFVTAHDHFAVEAFDIEAVDYVLKPVSADRLSRAISRAIARRGERAAQQSEWLDELWVPHRSELLRIAVNEVHRIDAERDYVRLHVAAPGEEASARGEGGRTYLLLQTIAGLEALGLTAEEVSATISEEGIGAAIGLVGERLGSLEEDAPEVGKAIAGICGGPGEDAGVRFLASLENINAETGSLIDTTSEYQQEQLRTLEVNQRFASVQNEIANEIGGTGATLSNLATQIQTAVLQAVGALIARGRRLFEIFEPVRASFLELFKALGFVDEVTEGQCEQCQRIVHAPGCRFAGGTRKCGADAQAWL